MANDLRLKGQETSVQVVQDGQLVASISAVSSFSDKIALEVLEEGFLGEAVNRFDEVLNGFGGQFEFQHSDPEWINFENAIVARATREQPNSVFNIVRTLFYANGQTAVVSYRDVRFGELAGTTGGRKEYDKVTVPWQCGARSTQINALL